MRLFYGLRFRPGSLRQVARLRDGLRPSGGAFSTQDNLHLTLTFLGEIPPDRVPPLRTLTEQIPPASIPRSLEFSRYGILGRQVLCLEADVSEPLTALQASLCHSLLDLGFSLEDRPFRAHMTLARRWKQAAPALEQPLCLAVQDLSLLLSHRPEGRLVYTPIASIFPEP